MLDISPRTETTLIIVYIAQLSARRNERAVERSIAAGTRSCLSSK